MINNIELRSIDEINEVIASPYCSFFEKKMTRYLEDLNELDGIGTAGEIVKIKYLKSNGEHGYFMANVFFKEGEDSKIYGQPSGFLSTRQNPDIVAQQIENYLAFQNPTNNVTFGYYSIKRHLDEINYLCRTQQNSWNAAGIKPDQLYTQLLAILDTTYDPANLLDSPLSQDVAERVSSGEQTQEFLRLLMDGLAKQQDSLKSRVLVVSAISVLELQAPDLQSSLIDIMLAHPGVQLSPNLQNNMLEICQKFNCHEIKIWRIITESNDTSRIQETYLTPKEEDTVRLFKNLLTVICDSYMPITKKISAVYSRASSSTSSSWKRTYPSSCSG